MGRSDIVGNVIFQKIWLWGPALVQMALIFYFSSQPAGSESLESFPLPGELGHFGGYALLSILFYRAFSGGFRREWSLRAAAWAFVIALAYGAWDEYYQSFIPGRHSSLYDVGINGAGALFAVLVFRVWVWVRGLFGAGERERQRQRNSSGAGE